MKFSFCPEAAVPEIPYVQDVLYALRLSESDFYYGFCATNHSTYVHNVHLVAAAVAHDVLNMEQGSEEKARRIIAKKILEMCPEEVPRDFDNAVLGAEQLLAT